MNVPWILWGAMFASTFLYLVVVAIVPRAAEPPPFELVLALGAAAFSAFGASVAIPPLVHAQAVAKAPFDVEEVPHPDASIVRGVPTQTLRVIQGEGAWRRAIALYQTRLVLAFGLTESIALLGFVLAFLGASTPTFLPFFVASWALFLWHRPSERAARAPIERATGAVFPPHARA